MSSNNVKDKLYSTIQWHTV